MELKATKTSNALIIIWLLISGFSVNAYIQMQRLKTIQTHGTVKKLGVEVYWDEALTNVTTVVNWGYPEPGSNTTILLWIENTGNYPKTNLSLWTEYWTPPEAENYMNVIWDREGHLLDKKGPVNTTITLSISEDIKAIMGFSFDMIIQGEG